MLVAPAVRVKLSREDRGSLGELLRRMYTALKDEPLSPRLKTTLEQLAENPSQRGQVDAYS